MVDNMEKDHINKKNNKRNDKKKKYHDIRSYVSSNRKFRQLVRAELRKKIDYDNYILPVRDRHTSYTWWDSKPYKLKVY